jgi:hypothetical protein
MRKKPLELASPSKSVRDGMIADNRRDAWMMLFLDGVPVVGVPPLSSRYVLGMQPGRYVAQWRSFFGDRVESAETHELPGTLVAGAPVPSATPSASAAPSALPARKP